MPIKITVRYHNTPIRMANIKKTDQGTSSGWESSGSDSTLPMQGAQVQPVVRELDPTYHSWVQVLQLRSSAAK